MRGQRGLAVGLAFVVIVAVTGATPASAATRPEPPSRLKATARLPHCPGAGEGGPGYASRGTRDSYVDLFDPLMDRRDLLIVDNRGTGDSGAINCPALQSYVGKQVDNVGACGQQLSDAADDYATGNAVEDMVAVLDSLGIAKVNLYGDSYGTFFGQTFATRHPERIRTVTLDAAYPDRGRRPLVPGLDAGDAERVPARVFTRARVRGTRRRSHQAHGHAGRAAPPGSRHRHRRGR